MAVEFMFKQCTLDDLYTLRDISCKTYEDTFSHLNTPANMRAYLEKAFHIDKLRKELSDVHSSFYSLYAEETLAGYFKCNEAPSQTDINDPQSLEIERIYVKKEFQGRGLGQALMGKAIEIAHTRGKISLWLGVWEKNNRAISFYQKNGFYETGTHSFWMGEEEQTDFILRKEL